ncbi:MAG: PLP-dependent aminotransferase family protein [Desulfobacteraceae bacterium]
MNLPPKLAQRTRHMGTNAIREILKVASEPGMISLAGGIPSPESFPLGLMQHLTGQVLAKYGASALQYDRTEGFAPLREALADHLSQFGIAAGYQDILISSGSQGVLDALAMIFISKGDTVAVESPTYIGALQAFTPYEPGYVGLEADEQGVIPEALEAALSTRAIKFIYLVPTFQNPTGRTLSLERRQAVARMIQRHDALLIEDDPYSALRYHGCTLPSIKSMAPEHVVYVSTLSKVFAPGLRIGFCVAPKPLRRWLVMVKQGVDLHTSTFNQALAAEYLSGGYLHDHLPKIIEIYRPRRTAMLNALKRYFPSTFTWSSPQGGMFIWAQGPAGVDMEKIYGQSVKQNVAFVPGTHFYATKGAGKETMRLNFTSCDESQLDDGIRTLAGVIDSAGNGA